MSKISIVIPTKDRLTFLRQAIPLYLAQDIVGEVIIIIDGSSDGTREYLAEFSTVEQRVQVIDNGTNKGIPYSRNTGIAKASCEFVFSTEDDLEITPDFLPTLLGHLHASGADIISGRNIFRREHETAEAAVRRADGLKGSPIDAKNVEINTNIALPDDQQQLLIASPMLARRSVFQDVCFDERYKVNFWREETDFQLSAQEKGYELVSCPHAVCFNFVIRNDRSGVHAVIGLHRAKWVVVNNWRFIRKHHVFIGKHFNTGNQYIYITKFAIRRLFIDCLLPTLIEFKARVLRSV